MWSILILKCLKYICLTLFFGYCFFLSPYWQKYCSFIPAGFFLPSYWQTSGNFVQAYFWHSVNTHIWTSLLFIYLPEYSIFISGVTHMENDLLFCFKLMFTNGNIVVCKYIIWFYSNLYFCQTHIWTSLIWDGQPVWRTKS